MTHDQTRYVCARPGCGVRPWYEFRPKLLLADVIDSPPRPPKVSLIEHCCGWLGYSSEAVAESLRVRLAERCR